MIIYKRFSLSGDQFYVEPAVLPLELPGITLFRGSNLDGVASKDLDNGAGKTRLIQLLGAFITNYTQRGGFKKLAGDKVKACLEFYDTKTKTEWSFSYDCPTNRWEVRANDVLLEAAPHQFLACQAFLQKTVHMSKEQWGYFCHINRKSIDIPLYGKPAQRREYFEEFFNIDARYEEQFQGYDKQLKSLNDRLELMSTDKVKLNQLRAIKDRGNGEEWLGRQLVFAKEALPIIHKNQNDLRQIKAKLERQLEDWREYQKLFAEAQGLMPLDALELRFERELKKEAKVKTEKDNANKARRAYASLRQLEERKPKELREPSFDEPLTELISDKEALLGQVRTKLKIKKKISKLTADLPDVTGLKDKLKDIRREIKANNKEILEMKQKIDLMETHGKVCGECGQKLPFVDDDEDVDLTLRRLKASLQQTLLENRSANGKIYTAEQFQTLAEQIRELRKELREFPEFGVKLSVAEAELVELKANAKQWEIYRRESKDFLKWERERDVILLEIETLGGKQLLETNFAEQLEKIREVLDDLRESIDTQKKLASLLEKIDEKVGVEKLEQENAFYARLLLMGSEALTEINVSQGKWQAELDEKSAVGKDIENLESSLVSYDELSKEHTVAKTLREFFSPKGFRMFELRKRLDRLVERANYWSPIFFQEPYEWSMPEDIEDLDFLVQPVNHRSTKPYSVSELSSGEGDRAARVILFSQLERIPPKKQSNLLFLDEVEGNLDQAGMTAFTDTVIPKLRETFPTKTIIIISHIPSLMKSPWVDHRWVAERKNRKTKLTTYPFYRRRLGKELAHSALLG